MTTLTVTADDANGSVILDLDRTEVVASITRTDVNGTADIRLVPYQLDGTGYAVVTDYEAAHGLNTYKALSASGSVLATSSATLTIEKPWLSVPVLPQLSVTVDQITDYGSSRASSTVVHQVIGRADPVVNIGKLGLRQGMLEIWTPDLATARALEEVIDSREILMLKQAVAGMDMYFTATDSDSAPYSAEGSATRYRFTVRYVEVKRPDAYLKGGRGWTYGALADSTISTYADLAAAYQTYHDMALDRRTW